MTVELEVFQIIQNEFNKAKLKNPAYSKRAFAKRLQLSPAAVCGIFNQKLRITKRAAEKIFYNIPISPDQKSRILSLLDNKKKTINKNKSTRDDAFSLVDMDQYHLISEWYYFAILSLSEIKGFQDDPKWVAQRLNIQIRQARRALETLERLNLLARDKAGKLCWTGKSFRTTSEIPHAAIRQSHFENLELAKRSLENDKVEECDFTAITMAIDPKRMKEAKEQIKIFRREFCQKLEAKGKKEVFKLVIQLFPLSGKK